MKISWCPVEGTRFSFGPTSSTKKSFRSVWLSPEGRCSRWWTPYMTANWETGWPSALAKTASCRRKASFRIRAGENGSLCCIVMNYFGGDVYLVYSIISVIISICRSERSRWQTSRTLIIKVQEATEQTSGDYAVRGRRRRKICGRVERKVLRPSLPASPPMRGWCSEKVGTQLSLVNLFLFIFIQSLMQHKSCSGKEKPDCLFALMNSDAT